MAVIKKTWKFSNLTCFFFFFFYLATGGENRGFTEHCVPADPGPTPGLPGEIFPSKGPEIYYPWMSAYAGTLTNGDGVVGWGPNQGFTRKNVPCSSGQYPGLYFGHHKAQN